MPRLGRLTGGRGAGSPGGNSLRGHETASRLSNQKSNLNNRESSILFLLPFLILRALRVLRGETSREGFAQGMARR